MQKPAKLLRRYKQEIAIPIDIFRVAEDGSLNWLETTKSLDSAILRANILAASLPGDYVITSQETGDKILLSLWGAKATTGN